MAQVMMLGPTKKDLQPQTTTRFTKRQVCWMGSGRIQSPFHEVFGTFFKWLSSIFLLNVPGLPGWFVLFPYTTMDYGFTSNTMPNHNSQSPGAAGAPKALYAMVNWPRAPPSSPVEPWRFEGLVMKNGCRIYWQWVTIPRSFHSNN